MSTKYSVIMDHFNNLILGTYPNTGFEPIRTVYERAFNMNINMQDVYETKLCIPTNPIKSIITLIGPEPKDGDIPTGLLGSDEMNVSYVTHFTNDIFKGMDNGLAEMYIESVFESIYNIVKHDRYNIKEIRNNPYLISVYCYPFYFTYYHIKRVFPDFIDHKVFIDIFEQYYSDREYADDVLKSLKANEFSSSSDTIYSVMTCKNTIPII